MSKNNLSFFPKIKDVGALFITGKQKEEIESLVKAGKKEEARQIILAIFNKAFGDS